MVSKFIFREYDIRGIYPDELNEQSVKLIGYFLGKAFLRDQAKRVAIGYDAREHSPILRDYLVSGLNFAGCDVYDMGMVPTPVNYFANFTPQKPLDSRSLHRDPIDIDASIMITGSHNPKAYNGFKITLKQMPFFGERIYALGREIEENAHMRIPTDTRRVAIDTKNDYIAFMLEAFASLKGLDRDIVVDCGNGVTGTVLKDIFDGLGLKWKGLYCDPDGTFPNHHPDPSEEENLRDLSEALQKQGDIGFAYDGDADRIAVLTKRHNIKGDMLALILSEAIENPTVIGEVKCSQIMYEELERRGAKAIMYKTGHSNLKVKMKETGADLACEVSGHIFFKHRYFGYDDAIYATLRVLELLRDGIELDAYMQSLPTVYSTDEIKIETSDEEKFALIDRIKALLKTPPSHFPAIKHIIDVDGVRIGFEKGWALVRASNTTPVLVTRFEASEEAAMYAYQDAVTKLIARAKEEA